MAGMALPAGLQSTVCMSKSSVNAATAVAERPAATTPVDTSKKPKELGFTMPGPPLHSTPATNLADAGFNIHLS